MTEIWNRNSIRTFHLDSSVCANCGLVTFNLRSFRRDFNKFQFHCFPPYISHLLIFAHIPEFPEKAAALREIKKFSEIYLRIFRSFHHLIFLPWFPEFSVEWFASKDSTISTFSGNFHGKFPYSFADFQNFWLKGKCSTRGSKGVKWELGFAFFRGWEIRFCALGLRFMKQKQ